MKLNQEELWAALGHLCRKIEACGASPELTAAVTLASDIRWSVGSKDNRPLDNAYSEVLKVIGGPIVALEHVGLKPHEQRVAVELDELNERIRKLHALLIDNDKLAKLDKVAVEDLVGQYHVMLAYQDILIRRLNRFRGIEPGPSEQPVQRSEKMAGTEPPSAIRELTSLAKGFRKDLDEVLQRMKAHRDEITTPGLYIEGVEDQLEVVANHIISLRAVEDAVMRQGMVLKCIGATPNPYPNSYKPESPVIEPTADGIKL